MREQFFFDNPAIDRVFGVVTQLASEVYILKDRCAALEKILAENGIVASDAIENSPHKLSNEEREAFIARLFEPIVQGDAASSEVADEFQLP